MLLVYTVNMVGEQGGIITREETINLTVTRMSVPGTIDLDLLLFYIHREQ